MKNFLPLLAVLCIAVVSCNTEPNWQDIEKQLQEQLILVEDGGTVKIPAGHYKFTGSLSLEGKKNITIKGAGMQETILNFKGQTDGAEGLTISDCENVVIEGFSVQDTKGDGIKSRKVNGIVFRDVTTEWTDGPKTTNGAYGFYPVMCENVLLEKCVANGASDAGIYVGQSKHIIVRNCTAKYNVAGIEIENCLYADVYENDAFKNTGGVLVFDMPGLSQSGGYVNVYNNKIYNNNLRNFAPEGNIVGTVPPGTGVMIVATSHVAIYENDIEDNRTMGAGIVSYASSGKTWDDTTFNPYSKAVYIHDNNFDRGFGLADMSNDLGKLVSVYFGFNVPDIIYDGTIDPDVLDANGNVLEEKRICIRNNGNATFANVDFPNQFQNIDEDITKYDCSHPAIEKANPQLTKLN